MDDRDAAEARLHELRHRYRNSFQIINSLVGLHARGIADPVAAAVLADLRSRVSMLSMIFMDLDNEGDSVDLAMFLPHIAHRAANLQSGDFACPLELEIAPAHLEKARAGILAQVLSEMLMSAYRAYRETPTGKSISVRLQAAKSGRLVLDVGLNGASILEADTAAGKLSLAIIKSMVVTLDGAFEHPTAADTARIEFADHVDRG